MSEKKLNIHELNNELKKIEDDRKMWNLSAGLSEVNVNKWQRQLVELERLHKDKIAKVELAIKRHVKNAKDCHKMLDDLLAKKTMVHAKMKESSNIGKIECEYCGRYYMPAGIARHKSACASKPKVKEVADRKAELIAEKKKIEARKAALDKEIAEFKSE